MTQNRFYSSATRQTTTTADPGISGNILTVTDSTVFAALDGQFPWTALINWGKPDQEVVDVTGRSSSGTTLTVVRGQDGSTGQAHPVGATVDHGVSARDFTEAGAHVGSSTGVHGLTGAVVGTTDTQTLASKTLTTPTIGSFANANHTHADTANGGLIKSAPALISNGGAVTLSTTLPAAFQDIPGLTFTLAAGATYRFETHFNYQAGGTSPTVTAGMGGTVTPSFLSYRASIQTNNGGGGTNLQDNVLSNANRQASAAIANTGVNLIVIMQGVIAVSTGGTLTAQMKLIGGTSPTGSVQAGGRFVLEQIA